MATLFPVMVTLVSVVAQQLPFVPPRRRLFRTDFRGCGAGGASFRNVADYFAFKTTLPISIAAIIGMAIPTSSGNVIWIKKSTSLMKC